MYSQGLSIKTPLNINYQIQALKSLRKGIEDYDRRRGWRGAITNKFKTKNWKNKIEQYQLDPTLEWRLAEITYVDNDEIKFKLIDKNNISEQGTLSLNNLKWFTAKNNSTNS